MAATGTYTFGFGVINVDTNTVYSGLLIGNLSFSVVPEPRTHALLALGTALGGLALLRQRRRSGRACCVRGERGSNAAIGRFYEVG